jgi:hypothetical protein
MPSLMCRYNVIFFYLENSLNLEYVENKSRLLLSGRLTAKYTSRQDKLVKNMTRNFDLLKSKLSAVFAT